MLEKHLIRGRFSPFSDMYNNAHGCRQGFELGKQLFKTEGISEMDLSLGKSARIF